MPNREIPLVGILTFAAAAQGQLAPRVDVEFSTTFPTSLGQSVYVLGDIPELGGASVSRSVKLVPAGGGLWRATIGIPAGRNYIYRYGWRNDTVSQWSNPANFNAISAFQSDATAPDETALAHKAVLYHSGWTDVRLFWKTASQAVFTETPMRIFGPGRAANEWQWRALLPDAGGEEIQFYMTDAGSGRDPAAGAYLSTLDALFLQEGQIFNYLPPATVSAQRQTNFATFASAALGENRPYRVLLPRGYDQNVAKRYPVIYMHDGQNVFDPGAFGSWNADDTAGNLTRNGRMRECIIIGVDNTANRLRDYMPPDDIVPFGPGAGQPGRANLYAQFLINELKPVIDATYRTLPDRESTITIGSSMGGLVSLYLGWDFNAAFGRVGPMSGSWQFANFPSRVALGPSRPLRVYLDSGDSGASNDNAWPTMNMRDVLLRGGWVLERDVQHYVGYGQQHNETAWAARVPRAFEFLVPAREETNGLLPRAFAGDLNCDGVVSVGDIGPFVTALTDPAGYAAQFPLCNLLYADINSDGFVTVGDIGGFVELISG